LPLETGAFGLDDLSLAQAEIRSASSDPKRVLKPVLRSKGFCWLDSEPLKMHEWAHAGRTIFVEAKTWWWSVLKEDQLQFQLSYPGAPNDYERVRKNCWDEEWGDQRQELVFIGGPDMSESDILPILDACLLTDEEMRDYVERTTGVFPPDTYFGVEGLLRQMGADPDAMRAEREAAAPEEGGVVDVSIASDGTNSIDSVYKERRSSAPSNGVGDVPLGHDDEEPPPPPKPKRRKAKLARAVAS